MRAASEGDVKSAKQATFKVGYRALNGNGEGDPVLKSIAGLWTPGSRFVVVHGGGDEIKRRQALHGLTETKIGGQRITDEHTLEYAVIPALTDINREVTDQLTRQGLRTQGFTADHQATTMLYAERDRTRGFVAQAPVINYDLLEGIQNLGITPVVAPISREKGFNQQRLNTNADVAAAAFPGHLYFLTDTPGVSDGTNIIETLTAEDAAELKHDRIIHGGMIVKVDSALRAARSKEEAGEAAEVVICDIAGLEARFRGEQAGTVVTVS